MGSEPEWENEDWEPAFDVALVKLTPRVEASKRSLFLRIDRRRADYFADVEDISARLSFADLPTQRQGALLQAGTFAPAWTGVLSLEEQPTRLDSLVEQPTLVWALADSLLAHIASLPTLPVLPVLDMAEENNEHYPQRRSRGCLSMLVQAGLRVLRSVSASSSSR